VHDLPDVALFAADGLWGHCYVFCFSDLDNGGSPCAGDPSTWVGAGGTSFAAPIMAGIQALINQRAGSAQGNPNYVYYQLASNAASVCDSGNGDPAGSPCLFHNVTQGDIAVNCGGAENCYGATMTYGRRGPLFGDGALSLSAATSAYAPAFGTSAGWNFATGIGSVNAYNLVMNWPQ
jgi:subtilase family serine protease